MHRSTTVYEWKQSKQICGWILMQETTGWTFSLEEALLLIMDSCFGQKRRFDMKTSQWWICLSQTCSFSLHKMLTDGLEWCGLLVDYCDVFISCLDSHSDGTHSLQRIHWWASDGMLHSSKSDEETNSSTSWMAWRLSTFSENTHFWVNYSFNIRSICPGIMRVASYLDFDCDRSHFQDKYTCTTIRIFDILPFVLSLFSWKPSDYFILNEGWKSVKQERNN